MQQIAISRSGSIVKWNGTLSTSGRWKRNDQSIHMLLPRMVPTASKSQVQTAPHWRGSACVVAVLVRRIRGPSCATRLASWAVRALCVSTSSSSRPSYSLDNFQTSLVERTILEIVVHLNSGVSQSRSKVRQNAQNHQAKGGGHHPT